MEVFLNDTELSWGKVGSYTVSFSDFDPSTVLNGKRYILTNCNFGQEFLAALNDSGSVAETTQENAIGVQVHRLTPSFNLVSAQDSFQLYESADGFHYRLLSNAARNAYPIPATAMVSNSVGVSPTLSSLIDTFFINMVEPAIVAPKNVRVKIDFSGCTISWDSTNRCGLTFTNHDVSEDVVATASPYHFIPRVGQSSVLVSAISNGVESVATETGNYFFFQTPEVPTLTAEHKNGSVHVQWSIVDFNGVIVQYKLHRSTGLHEPQPVSFVGHEYRDVETKPGQTYRYILTPHYSDPNGLANLPQPSPIVAVARAPIQTYLPLWSNGISKASAVATLYVSLADMLSAFEIDPVNQIYYFHVQRMKSIFSLNPAFAVVTRGASLTQANGVDFNEYQLMAENDYIRFLALQLWGNAALTCLFTNVPSVLIDVQAQCAAAMHNVEAILGSVDINAEAPASNMVKTEKGWGFLATEISPLNLCSVFMDNLQAAGRFDGSCTNLPFIDGDSFLFEVNFQQAGFIARSYYIQFIMKKLVPAQPSTDRKSLVNWI